MFHKSDSLETKRLVTTASVTFDDADTGNKMNTEKIRSVCRPLELDEQVWSLSQWLRAASPHQCGVPPCPREHAMLLW